MFIVRVGTGPLFEVPCAPMSLVGVGTGPFQSVGKNGEQKFEIGPLFTAVFPFLGVPPV